MKKYLLSLLTITIFPINMLCSCPFSFSPEDQRPFFEQYQDISTSSPTKEE